jgi:hypothetical protein
MSSRIPMRRSRQAKPNTAPSTEPGHSDAELLEALEVAAMDAVRGDPPGPTLATRLQRVCIDVLRHAGIQGAKVHAVSTRKGTAVRVLLPSDGARVRQLELTLG